MGRMTENTTTPSMTTEPATTDDATRIAMWSGPRNISTAMMRAWGNRPDTVVCDEPLYAHYLKYTGLDHPGRDDVLAHHPTDWRKAVEPLDGPLEPGVKIFYQKHMAHHLLSHIELDWMDHVTSCFLIRQPREMLTSLLPFVPEPRLEDTGLPQQIRVFEWIRKTRGTPPPVIDARYVLQDPRRLLALLCEAVGVEFTEAMLTWPPGGRETDGAWHKHLYTNVTQSTGFAPYRPKNDHLPERFAPLLDQCNALYEHLWGYRIV